MGAGGSETDVGLRSMQQLAQRAAGRGGGGSFAGKILRCAQDDSEGGMAFVGQILRGAQDDKER